MLLLAAWPSRTQGGRFPVFPGKTHFDASSAWRSPRRGLALGSRAPSLSVRLRGRLQEAGSSSICVSRSERVSALLLLLVASVLLVAARQAACVDGVGDLAHS